MRATPLLLVVVAILVAGCSAESPGADDADLGPLADQADRVAMLIDQDRPCEAVEAARTLASLADTTDVDAQVGQAVTSFAASAESSIVCEPGTTDPATDPPPPPPEEADDGDEDDDGDDDGDDGDEGDDGDDEDDQNGQERENPGEGKAKGRDKDNPGRGNGDD